MYLSKAVLLGLGFLAAQTHGHGLVVKPAARQAGAATQTVCGAKMVQFYQKDNTSYPEALHRQYPSGLGADFDATKCNLYLCRGYQFGDNKQNVQTYKAGDKVDVEVTIRIPHKGYANVSVVDLTTNTVIGDPLKKWADNYAATLSPPKDQTQFSVTIPDLGTQCTKPDQCVRWMPLPPC